jgi:UDPglucose 6-dehydrogenase
MNNTFFATKVSIMNEFKLLCDKIGANWEDALRGFVSDGRIGDSHLNVPGHDGKLGYGGTCFPKDVNALLSFSKKYDIQLNTINGGWKTNLKVRHEKEWEKNEGRSVSFKKNNNT